MQDFTDYSVAEQAVRDPQTPVSMLMLIAWYHPNLRTAISTHPNVDDPLLEWLKNPTPTPQHPEPNGPGVAPRKPPPKHRIGLIIGIVAEVVALIAATILGVYLFGGYRDMPPETTEPVGTKPVGTSHSGSIEAEIYTFGGTGNDSFARVVIDSGGVIFTGGLFDGSYKDGEYSGVRKWVVIDTQGNSTITQVDLFSPLTTLNDGRLLTTDFTVLAAVTPSGAVMWRATAMREIAGVAVALDGSIAVVGLNQYRENIVILLNPDGTTRWTHNYGSYSDWAGAFDDVAFFGDGSLGVVSGYSESWGMERRGALLVNISPQGDISSVVSLPMTSDKLTSAIATSDGGIVAAGAAYHDSASGGTRDALIVKFSAEGEIQWTKEYGGSEYDYFLDVTVDVSGRIFVAGITESHDGDFSERPVQGIQGAYDAVIAQLESDGSLGWAQVWAGSHYDDLWSIVVNEGRVCAVGSTNSSDGVFTGTTGNVMGTTDALVICTTYA